LEIVPDNPLNEYVKARLGVYTSLMTQVELWWGFGHVWYVAGGTSPAEGSLEGNFEFVSYAYLLQHHYSATLVVMVNIYQTSNIKLSTRGSS